MVAIAALDAVTTKVRRPRVKVGIVCAAIASALGCMISLAPAASANTKSNWSEVVDGIDVGWTANHVWAIASYATVIKFGAGQAAAIACDALTEEEGIGYVCDQAVEEVVEQLLKNEAKLTDHGIWVALYPTVWGRFNLTDGKY